MHEAKTKDANSSSVTSKIVQPAATTKCDNKKQVKTIDRKIKDLEQHVSQINDRTKQSKVLNGGFDTLIFKVDAIADTQKQTRSEVAEIHKAIYDPETGLWVRVKANERDQRTIEQLQEEILKLKVFRDEQTTNKEKLHEIESKLKDHKDHIETAMKNRQMIWSIVKWAGITAGSATIGGLIKLLYDSFF